MWQRTQRMRYVKAIEIKEERGEPRKRMSRKGEMRGVQSVGGGGEVKGVLGQEEGEV